MTTTLLTIALVLIAIDLFIASDITTHAAYLIIAYVVATLFDVSLPIQILIGVCTWMATVIFHYLFFRTVIERFANRFVTPDKIPSPDNRLIGRSGTIVELEGQLMLKIDGDVIPVDHDTSIKDGDNVTVKSMHDGTPLVETH